MPAPGVGNTTVVYNTRERLVSTDPNRAQAFIGQSIAEVMRFFLDAQNELDVGGGGFEVMGSGAETFLRGTVLNGLRPRPEIGTTNLFIEPGVALVVDNTTPSSDESRAAWVTDPGVSLAGALTLTPGGGATRIDVIECQRVLTVLESDSRDIFNPGTGLFTPALVTKVQTGRLTYRIRTGTPGAGFPGVAAGWMPLAVCSVPAGSLTWDSVTLWDVRPLASDRTNGCFNSPKTMPLYDRNSIFIDPLTAPTERRLQGQVELDFGGYRAGGRLLPPTSGEIDLMNTDYHSAGFGGFAINQIWHLYAVFPFGLPRWVRYSSFSTGARIPRGARGILAVSSISPRYDGRPITGVNSPAATGLLDTPAQANSVCLFSGRVDQGGTPRPLGMIGDGKGMWLVAPPAFTQSPTSTSGSAWAQWTLTANTHFPGTARAIYVRFFAEFTEVNNPDQSFQIDTQVSVGLFNLLPIQLVDCEGGTGHALTWHANIVGTLTSVEFTARIPLQPDFDFAIAFRAFNVRWTYNAPVAITVQNQTAQVIGWDLNP